MSVSLDGLRAFLAVAEFGNMSRAAVKLSVTQPSLSWSIKKLEEQAGTPLFVRTKKGMHLTHAGETFLARSRDLVRNWDGLLRALHEDEEEIRGTYRIGVHPTVATFTVPSFCPALMESYPDLKLELAHDTSSGVAQGVIGFKYDLGIVVNPPAHPDLTIVNLFPDEIGFWVLKDATPLQDPARAGAVVVVNPRMSQVDVLLKEARERGLLAAERILETTNLKLIAAMVEVGGGIGVLPATLCRAVPGDILAPLEGWPTYADMITLVWRHDLQKSHASRVIREAIIGALKK